MTAQSLAYSLLYFVEAHRYCAEFLQSTRAEIAALWLQMIYAGSLYFAALSFVKKQHISDGSIIEIA